MKGTISFVALKRFKVCEYGFKWYIYMEKLQKRAFFKSVL